MNLINKIFNKKNKQNLRSSICQAPFKSLRFEPLGVMRTCCYNIQVVAGKYPEKSILEAWNSSEMNVLREKLNNHDLSYGCRLCADQINSGELNTVKFKQYDNLPSSENNFPVVLDFSLHNTCNLECVMCHGEFSSSIRKNREHLPAMKMVYDETFVEQLHPFIKHAKQFVFAGGEPFLIDIHYSIWDKIVELNSTVLIHVVTNGTVLNTRVKSILNLLKFNITISIDAFEQKLYEQIRINANYERLMKNFEFFKKYCAENKTEFAINVCPIQLNRFHLPEMIQHCNENQIKVYFLYVIHPASSTLQSLTLLELEEISALYSKVDIEANTEIQRHNKLQFDDLIVRVKAWMTKKQYDSVEDIDTSVENLVDFNFYIQLIQKKSIEFFDLHPHEIDSESIYAKIESINRTFLNKKIKKGIVDEIESISPERIVNFMRSSSELDLIHSVENLIL